MESIPISCGTPAATSPCPGQLPATVRTLEVIPVESEIPPRFDGTETQKDFISAVIVLAGVVGLLVVMFLWADVVRRRRARSGVSQTVVIALQGVNGGGGGDGGVHGSNNEGGLGDRDHVSEETLRNTMTSVRSSLRVPSEETLGGSEAVGGEAMRDMSVVDGGSSRPGDENAAPRTPPPAHRGYVLDMQWV